MGVKRGDVIQVTDPNHAWFPALLIVDEVKGWGVIAYTVIPQTNDGSVAPKHAYNRLLYKQIERIGEAALVRAD